MLLANRPRPVRLPGRPEWLVCTDANRWGWGYVALNTKTYEVRTHGAEWSWWIRNHHGDRLGHSTFTEPQGILDAPIRFRADSCVAQAAYTWGFNSQSYDISECLRRLCTTFGDRVTFEFTHVARPTEPG
jgi:hypothetical protein